MNIEQVRSLFPVTKEAVFLNNASQAPLNTLVNEKLQAYLAKEMNPVGKRGFQRDTVRGLLSQLLGGLPNEYALTTSTGVGLGIVAQGLEWNRGDNIVIPAREHWNNTFPWLQLEAKGVEVRLARINPDQSIDPEAIEELVDESTRVVTLAAVRFNSGFRPDLAAIGKIARAKGALFVVDAAQAAGMIPIDVVSDQIDVLSGCGFKWLLGFHGTGFLYVSSRVVSMIKSALPGMYAAEKVYDKLVLYDDARKFETGTIAYSLFTAWTAGLELLLEIGVDNVYARVLELTDYLIIGLREKGYHIVTPTRNRSERTAIVHFNTGNLASTKELYERLRANNVLVTLQAENIRVSPNFYTVREEIDIFLGLV